MKNFQRITTLIPVLLMTSLLVACGQQEVDVRDLDDRRSRGVFLDREPFSGVAISYDDDGAAIKKVEFKDGFPFGKVTEYDKDGKLISEGVFEKENAVGKHQKWSSDGKLIAVQEFNELGELHGASETTCENGQVSFQGNYVSGKRDSLHQSWYCDGQLKESHEFSQGISIGAYDKFDEQGVSLVQGTYLEDGSGQKLGLWSIKATNGITSYSFYGEDAFINPKYRAALFKTSGFNSRKSRDWGRYSSSVEDLKIYLDQALIDPNLKVPFEYGTDSTTKQKYYSSWSYPIILAGDEVYQYLKNSGSDLSVKDSKGLTRFHYCVQNISRCSIEQLAELAPKADLVNKTSINPVDVVTNWNVTKVYNKKDTKKVEQRIGDLARQLKALELLRENGQDMASLDSSGRTALINTVRGETPYLFDYFVKNSDINAKDKAGYTALHHALNAGKLNVAKTNATKRKRIEQLVLAGAKIDEPLPTGQTMSEAALESGSLDVVKFIARLGSMSTSTTLANVDTENTMTMDNNVDMSQPSTQGLVSIDDMALMPMDASGSSGFESTDDITLRLKTTAFENIAKLNLQSPKGKNASENLDELKAMDPYSPEVAEVEAAIAEAYYKLAKKSAVKDRVSNAKKYIAAAEKFNLNNDSVLEVEKEIVAATVRVKAKKSSAGEWGAEYAGSDDSGLSTETIKKLKAEGVSAEQIQSLAKSGLSKEMLTQLNGSDSPLSVLSSLSSAQGTNSETDKILGAVSALQKLKDGDLSEDPVGGLLSIFGALSGGGQGDSKDKKENNTAETVGNVMKMFGQ